jgi:hypothetical protein
MSRTNMCFTEPTAIPCPACGVGIAEWCLKDGRERKWIDGAPVHLERIAAVDRAYPPRPYPTEQKHYDKVVEYARVVLDS